MLQYARGFVPQMLPFGLLCSTMTTLDFRSARHQIWDFGRILVKELLRGKL
jgi:C-8 sterol isomerase